MALVDEVQAFVRHEVETFAKALADSPDLVLAVLRFHLIAENLLERIILARLPRGDRVIEKGGLSFSQKLHLVDALDELDDSTVQALRRLNGLRNECAHERDKTIVGSDIDLIGRPLGARFTKIRRERADDTRALAVGTFSQVYQDLLAKVAFLEFSDVIQLAKSGDKAPSGMQTGAAT